MTEAFVAETHFSAVEIEINHACNRKCSYCPNSRLERANQGEIRPELFQKLLGELASICFAGRISYDFYNEPMIHSDLESIVGKTRAALPLATIELYTNGTRLTLDRFRALVSSGINRFIVTRHEAEVNFLFLRTYASLDADERERVTYRDFTALRLTNRGGTLPHLGSKGVVLAACQIPSSIVTVTVNGNVLPCFEDFHEFQVMGNIEHSTLLEIWNSQKYSAFRADLRRGLRHLHAPCRDCNRVETLFPAFAKAN